MKSTGQNEEMRYLKAGEGGCQILKRGLSYIELCIIDDEYLMFFEDNKDEPCEIAIDRNKAEYDHDEIFKPR